MLAFAVSLAALWIIVPVFSCVSLAGVAGNIEEFEIVESIPVETTLDNEDIRNTYDVWLEMIHSASKSLEFAEFYVSDETGEPLSDVIQAVVEAGRRGVRVRFVVDSKMYRTYPLPLDSLAVQQGIEVRILNFGAIAGGVMHAKYFIVDKRELFLGSQNFDWRALKHIHELGCRVRSHELATLFLNLFEADWKLAQTAEDTRASWVVVSPAENTVSGEAAVPANLRARAENLFSRTQERGTLPLRKVDSARGDTMEVWPTYSPAGFIPDKQLWDEPAIVSLIESGQKEVAVQLLTYGSLYRGGYYPVLENALRSAAARGVQVRILTSDWAKARPDIDCLKSLSVLPNIEVRMTTIPEWSGGFIPYARVEHCKYLVVDGEAFWIGTSNWEKDYFYNSRNVGLIVKNRAVAQAVRHIFYKSWESSYAYPVKPEVDYVPPKRTS